MANRRCFSVKKCQSVQFLNMPAGAQALYLAILGIVDDDGIFEVNYAKRLANRRKQDVDALLANGYITIIDRELNLAYVVDWHAFNSFDTRSAVPSRFRQALVNTIPSVKNALFTPRKNAFGVENTRIKEKKTKENNLTKYKGEVGVLWRDFPRQEGEQTGVKYYSRSRDAGATAQEIAEGTKRYIEKVRREKRDKQYIKTFGNFFREELWREDHSVKRDPAVDEDSRELDKVFQ